MADNMSNAARFALALSITAMALALVNCASEQADGAPSGSPPTSITAGGRDAAPPVTQLPVTPTGPALGVTGNDASVVDATAIDAHAYKADAAVKVDAATNTPPGDPCATVTCAANEACVPYAHGHALGACVPTCDCSNCGNCGGDNSDHRWDDQQEYCGNPASSPATTTCNNPCQGGMGCIPFGAVSICWPMQGCFSL